MKKQQLIKIIKEEIQEITNGKPRFSPTKEEKELYELEKQFLPAFRDYVSLYNIYSAEGTTEDSYFNDPQYQKVLREFAKELQNVLFKLEKGVF